MEAHVIDLLINRFGQNPEDWRYTHVSKRYLVSNFGEVISLIRKPRILKKTLTTTGYWYVSIMIDGKPIKKLIHRLAAESFCKGKTEHKNIINHKNGIKTDNNVSNLEWSSYKENNDHAKQMRLNKCFCETHFAAKLTSKNVQEIKENLFGLSFKEMSYKYGVSPTCISKIVSGKAWRRHEL